jgi:hypothetical protein
MTTLRPALKHPGDRPTGQTPRSPGKWQQAMALLVLVAALGLYVTTLAPTVATIFDDSLEFQLVTYLLGIAHPTGYPLYTLLGWLFTRLPVGDVAYRVNLMSAAFGAATVALVYLLGLELAAQSMRWPSLKHLGGVYWSWMQVVSALIGALALAVSPVFWSQATVAEVYTLNAAFVAGILWFLVRRTRIEADTMGAPAEKSLLILGFLFGLSLTHHRTMLLLLPAILFYLWHQSEAWRQDISSRHGASLTRDRLRTGAKLVGAFILPLLLYLYIPIRGNVGSLDGTYTNTLGGFWRHVTASGYGAFIFGNPFGAERGVGFYTSLFLTQFGPLGVAAGLLGLLVLLRRQAGKLLGIAFATYLVFNLVYHVADIQVFFIPLFLIWAVWIGVAACWLLMRIQGLRPHRLAGLRVPVSLMAGLVLAGQSVLLMQSNVSTLNRSHDWMVHDYGVDVMSQPLEPRATIVGILGETTLVRYFQATEGLRPDLLSIAADRESERLATVDRLLEQDQAVYLTRDLPGAASRWSLSAVGPLIRVNPKPLLEAPATSSPVDSSLIPQIALYSYTVSHPPTHENPPPLRVNLTWHALAPINRELKVSTRLVGTDGQAVAQADAVPVHFAYPTGAWRPGEFIADVYDLPVPAGLEPGQYAPLVILYDPAQAAAEVGRVVLPPINLP